MALTYVAFLTVYRWQQGPGITKVLNVVDAKETTRWNGSMRPAYDSTMLSTLRNPKRVWAVTVEFNSGLEHDLFMAFISTIDTQGKQSGLTDMGIMASPPTQTHAMTRTAHLPTRVYIQPLESTAIGEQVVAGVVTPMWQMTLTISEI